MTRLSLEMHTHLKTDQNFEITDQKQTLFKRNNRPIPDPSHLDNRPDKTNNRLIPDLIKQIIDQYQTRPYLRGIT